MGGKKKKGGGGKKGKDGDEEDVSVDNFMKFYKRKCAELQCDVSKILKEKYEEYLEEGDPITKVSIYTVTTLIVPHLGRDGMAWGACIH